jgi:hypothetical protein
MIKLKWLGFNLNGVYWMAKFEKMSLWYMCAMTLSTLHLFLFAWIVETTRRLRIAGGKIPNTYFYFALYWGPLLLLITTVIIYKFSHYEGTGFAPGYLRFLENDLRFLFPCLMTLFVIMRAYFWFGYVRSYCQIVQQKNDKKFIGIYFVLTVLLQYTYSIVIYGMKYLEKVAFLQFSKHMFVNSAVIMFIFNYIVSGILISVVFFFLFQRGYNNYENLNN